MSSLLALILTAIVVVLLQWGPSTVAVRLLGGSWALALALAPACGLGLAGLSALLAGRIGVTWSPLPLLAGAALLIACALLLRALGVRLPSTALDGAVCERRQALWAVPAIIGALVIALAPILRAAGQPDAVLERWDALYHLSALARIRDTGNASSLVIGSVSNAVGRPHPYPGGFHALASAVPEVSIPVLMNAAGLAVSVLPWVVGTALLARAVHPRVSWAAPAGAVLATLIPAAPWNEWVHLSAVPNMTGSAALPGFLAGAVALWGALRPVLAGEQQAEASASSHPVRHGLAITAVLAGGGLGLGVAHPNVAVTALLLLLALTAVTTVSAWVRRPWLVLLPLVFLAPVVFLMRSPLASSVTDFVGGLQISWWAAIGEVALGLLTVWPMALGVIIALLWWPGLVACARDPQRRWLVAAWAVIVVLYLDAAVDSPLNLSVLYYRGQDRIAMPLAMLSCVAAVSGLRVWSRVLGPVGADGRRSRASAPMIAALAVVAVALAGLSLPTRADNAAKNLAPDYPGRGRFLQADEREAWAQAAPTMDKSLRVMANPFSGASHMYALHGQPVYFPVAGISLVPADRFYRDSMALAPSSPKHCQALKDANIGYYYVDQLQYQSQYDPALRAISQPIDGLGTVVFRTDHSVLIRIDCTLPKESE